MVHFEEFDLDPDEVWVEDLPRFMKFPLVYDALTDTGGGHWLGAGVGQFRGNKIGNTTFLKKYGWAVSGSRAWMLFVWVELGYLGLIWYYLSRGYYFFGKGSEASRHFGKRMLFYLFINFIIVQIYNDAPRNPEFEVVFLAVLMLLKNYKSPQEIADMEIAARQTRGQNSKALWRRI